MKRNDLTAHNHNAARIDDPSTLLSYDIESKDIINIVLGSLGNALWELGKEVWSSATDSGRVNIKDLVDFQSFLFSMSNESRRTLESSLERAEKLSKLIERAEKDYQPELAKDYRSQLSNTYEQMSITVRQEAYRFEERHPGQGDYARRFANHLLNISEKVRTPGSAVPAFDIRDLRRSQNGLGQSSLVATSALKNNAQANISAFSSLSAIRGSLEAGVGAKQLNSTGNADLDKALAILDEMKQEHATSAEQQKATPEPVAVRSRKDREIGG